MEPNLDRNSLIQKYSNFFKIKKLDIDKEVLAETSNLQLLSTLAMLAPFNKIDKQAILESANVMDRINVLNSILDLNTFQVVSNGKPNQLN
jgi:Lon protease-like protein